MIDALAYKKIIKLPFEASVHYQTIFCYIGNGGIFGV